MACRWRGRADAGIISPIQSGFLRAYRRASLPAHRVGQGAAATRIQARMQAVVGMHATNSVRHIVGNGALNSVLPVASS